MSIRFRQLKYFLKVVETGGFTRAAESLNVAQPALSQQIAKLEIELGAPLLIRTPTGAVPTEGGHILYRCGQQILQQLDIARAEIKASSESPSGHVSIGMPGSVSLIATVPILSTIRETLPNVVAEIREADNDQLSEMLLNGRLDIALLNNQGAFKGIQAETILRERMFLIFKADPPFDIPQTSPVTLQELSKVPLILPSASAPKRQLIEALFRSSDLPLNLVAETSAISTTVSAVLAGLGAAILPWSAAASGLAKGDLAALAIEQPRFSRPISLCTSQAHPSSAAALATAKAVKQVICKLIDEGVWKEIERFAETSAPR